MKPIEHPISFSWASNVETLPSPQGGLLYLTATGLTSWKPLRAFHRLGLRLGRCPPQETLHDQCLAPNHERSILEQGFYNWDFRSTTISVLPTAIIHPRSAEDVSCTRVACGGFSGPPELGCGATLYSLPTKWWLIWTQRVYASICYSCFKRSGRWKTPLSHVGSASKPADKRGVTVVPYWRSNIIWSGMLQ